VKHGQTAEPELASAGDVQGKVGEYFLAWPAKGVGDRQCPDQYLGGPPRSRKESRDRGP